jgi:hypothetical protein
MEATYRNKTYFANIGAMAGVSDLIVVLPNKVLFLEMKSKTGRQSVDQKNFQHHIEELGFNYYIVRDFDEFKTIIENNLKL